MHTLGARVIVLKFILWTGVGIFDLNNSKVIKRVTYVTMRIYYMPGILGGECWWERVLGGGLSRGEKDRRDTLVVDADRPLPVSSCKIYFYIITSVGTVGTYARACDLFISRPVATSSSADRRRSYRFRRRRPCPRAQEVSCAAVTVRGALVS